MKVKLNSWFLLGSLCLAGTVPVFPHFKQAVLLKRIAVGFYAAYRGVAVLHFGAFIRQTR
ncbi:TPA: hypothetical protein ACVBYD_000691 [Yersinia enterocolitica]